jgi:hypothetical protein
MALLDSCSLPSFNNDADGATGGPFEDTTLMSLGKANTIHENISQKLQYPSRCLDKVPNK